MEGNQLKSVVMLLHFCWEM